MPKKQSKFLTQQKFALGLFAAMLLGIIGFLSVKTIEEAPLGEFLEGEHYQLIENPRRIRGNSIEIIEFFSYGCVHCFRLEPLLADWLEEQGDDVNFRRIPAIASEYWRILGRAYFTLEQMGLIDDYHMTIFRTLHQTQRDLATPELLFRFIEEAGIDRETFESTYRSSQVIAAMDQADQMARRLKVAAVPTIIVQGKYSVRTTRSIGQKRMLDVMDHLAAIERSIKTEG